MPYIWFSKTQQTYGNSKDSTQKGQDQQEGRMSYPLPHHQGQEAKVHILWHHGIRTGVGREERKGTPQHTEQYKAQRTPFGKVRRGTGWFPRT